MKLLLPNPVQTTPPARARRGMALVITLIMLSVTLIMAIAFLAVSNRERAAVTTSADQANARLALDSALNAAQAQILANVIGTTNGAYNFGLLVSTNFINSYGFQPNNTSPTNVNFDYRFNGVLQAGDFEANVANLLYLPRAPVMVSAAEPNGRFYLDLNRNGIFDATGINVSYVDATGTTNGVISQIGDPQWIGALERPDTVHSPNNLFTYRYAFIAVPIGNGLDLNFMHNQSSTKTVNTSTLGSGSVADGYLRNQGVGSWEINLAAFLAALNTNQWLPDVPPANAYYSYNEPGGFANSGVAFDDARSLLSWRYDYSYGTLAPASSIFSNAVAVFPYDNIDEYGDGPPQTTTTNIFENLSAPTDGDLNPKTAGWAGGDSTNRFFDLPFELFDPSKSSSNFVSRLTAAGTNTINSAHPTYDTYTFYRLLSELGTDSTADDIGKIDLNYSNAAAQFNSSGLLANITVTPGAQTNLVPWVPSQFFTIAVDRMLHAYTTFWFESNPSNYLTTYYGIQNYPFYIDPVTGYGFTNSVLGTNMVPAFGITNIPVMIGGQVVYSPAVNRIMQLAANIYDASTNGFFPSVYRPDFYKDNLGNVFVTGYEPVTNISRGIFDPQLTLITNVLALPFGYTSSLQGNMQNIYGIPWIIGAKKNLPSFNQLYTQNAVQVTRKMQVWRTSGTITYSGANTGQYFTNQQYVISITNHVGFSLWNSYSTNYPGGQPTIVVNDYMSMVLSNSQYYMVGATNYQFAVTSNIWPGSSWDLTVAPIFRNPSGNSFVYGGWDFAFQPVGVYQFASGIIEPLTQIPQPTFIPTETTLFNLPDFGMDTTNYVQAYILDRGHIIDYVQLDGPGSVRDLSSELADPYNNGANLSPYPMWVTNGAGRAQTGPPLGPFNQIRASLIGPSAVATGSDGWSAPSANMPAGTSGNPTYEAAYFQAFFAGTSTSGGYTFDNTDLTNQVPYTPVRTMFDLTLWQANDPLVHYLTSDLTESNSLTGVHRIDGLVSTPITTVVQNGLGQSGTIIGDDRYQPWGVTNQMLRLPNVDVNAYNLAYRDPLVFGSDNWDFPANRYPNVGWLGRVHRGTPWQTVYLKSTNILNLVGSSGIPTGLITWMDWSGNGNVFDANNAAPAQDDILFDVFTTALDDNTSRGTLSVNQTHLAAWSALLAGVNVSSDATPNSGFGFAPVQSSLFINPAGPDTNSPLYQIVQGTNGINAVRSNPALFPGGAFTRPGDILRVPALTEQSPFLGATNTAQRQYDISDEMYERIPQQIMGLLRVGSPRYVIYCYGQALRPAQDGTALDLAHNGLVTNYQVVAESLARAVISVHPQISTPVISPTTGNYVPVTNYTTSVDSYNLLPPN